MKKVSRALLSGNTRIFLRQAVLTCLFLSVIAVTLYILINSPA
jgi:hypothetical protein